jgi:hypothetical protein
MSSKPSNGQCVNGVCFDNRRIPPPPSPGEPPFPWECDLNFFLKHRSVGLYPLLFDITQETSRIVFLPPQGQTIHAWPADMAHPASQPFITHMPICALADDTAPVFPWPFTVYNPDGISCADVFEEVFLNFNQPVSQEEYETWTKMRQDNAAGTYYQRIRRSQESTGGHGLRRVDYLGGRVMFRGLEPSPEKDGTWIMFTGPQ